MTRATRSPISWSNRCLVTILNILYIARFASISTLEIVPADTKKRRTRNEGDRIESVKGKELEVDGKKKDSRIRISPINRGNPWGVSRRLTEKFVCTGHHENTFLSNSMDKLARTRRLDFRCSWTDLGQPIPDSSTRICAKLGQRLFPSLLPITLFAPDPTFPKLYFDSSIHVQRFARTRSNEIPHPSISRM